MIRASLLLCSALALSGCITLLPEPPPAPRLFVLEAGQVAPSQADPVDAVVAVSTPIGERAVLGPDMVWRTGDELAYVAQTQWSARADAALQAMLIETMTRQNRFRAVSRSGEGRADYELRWEILSFAISEDEMEARFVANVRMLRSPGRIIVAQRIISAEAPVTDRSQAVAAQALTRAAREGSARIANFAAEEAARAAAD